MQLLLACCTACFDLEELLGSMLQESGAEYIQCILFVGHMHAASCVNAK